MPTRLPTPPAGMPSLILCADGGGSKVCVVIRSSDGLEVRGTAGPCNVQSVGHGNGAQAILIATYRALSLLPQSHLPDDLSIPILPIQTGETSVQSAVQASHGLPPSPPSVATLSIPSTPNASRSTSPSPRQTPLPPINVPTFKYAWLALAGISTPFDAQAFAPHPAKALNLPIENIKVTNDVNLLAAPALELPGIRHVVAVVCGTGTVGRTIRVGHTSQTGVKQLPLEDVGVARGWGYLLCDEGSAFWIGRLAMRLLLAHADRHASTSIHSSVPPPILPFHRDLLSYFDVEDPMDLIELVSLTGRWVGDGPVDPGEVSARRNAMLAGAARVVLRWAFPDDGHASPPSPPASSTSSHTSPSMDIEDPIAASHAEALQLARQSITPLLDLTMMLLGDRSIVRPHETALALGGGLMMSKGYRGLLLEGLKKQGIEMGTVQIVSDAAGVGAMGLAGVEFA